MAKFRSSKELAAYVKAFGIVTSAHKAILIHPNSGLSEVPADQVQHYLDKGFKWPKS